MTRTRSQDEHQAYLDERRILIDLEKESSRSFDKAMLTLSAGALGLSITFIRQISPSPLLGTLGFLKVAWICFALSILTTLMSFLLSQSAIRKQREILDQKRREILGQDRQEESNVKEQNNWLASATNALNWVSVLFFTVGIGLLSWFSIENLPE